MIFPLHPRIRSGSSKPTRTLGVEEKHTDVSVLTGLQLGQVILPQEAASHEHREQEEEAAGSREEPLLFYLQQTEPAASLEGGGRRSMAVSQREERAGPLPWPLLRLRFTQTP